MISVHIKAGDCEVTVSSNKSSSTVSGIRGEAEKALQDAVRQRRTMPVPQQRLLYQQGTQATYGGQS